MSENVIIRPYTESDFADIIRIAKKRIGDNYLSTNDLQHYLSNIGIVAEVDHRVVGFSLAKVLTSKEALGLVLADHAWFINQFSKLDTLGILKTYAVDSSYSNQGIGEKLVTTVINELKQTTKHLLVVSWIQQKENYNIKILERLGMSPKHEIKNYWQKNGLEKKYDCQLCGAPPCTCSALIYLSEV